MTQKRTHYQVLGVLQDAPEVVIRAAYKALAQKYHPDKCSMDVAEAQRRMSEINVAYNCLSNQTSRQNYDKSLSGEAADFPSANKDEECDLNNRENSSADFQPDMHGNYAHAKGSGYPSLRNEISWVYMLFLVAFVLFLSYKFLGEVGLNQHKPMPLEGANNSMSPKYSIDKKIVPKAGLSLTSSRKDFELDLHRDGDGIYRLFVNNAKYEGVGFSTISEVYEISMKGEVTAYILVTNCAGNGCGPEFWMLDIEHSQITRVPIDDGRFYSDLQGLKVSGSNGLTKIGDPVKVSLAYEVVSNNLGGNSAFWADALLKPSLRKLIGRHPEVFFEDDTLRSDMISQLGEEQFKAIRERTQVAEFIYVVNGSLLVMQGCKPRACDSEWALTIINGRSGHVFAFYKVIGDLFSVGTPLVDESINIGGFGVSAYEWILNTYLEGRYEAFRVTVNDKGELQFGYK